MSFVWGIGKASGHRVVPYLTNRAALWCWHPGPWPEGKTRCAANEREQQNPGDKHWEAWHFLNKVVINVCVVDNAVSVLALKPFKCVCVHCSINFFWGTNWKRAYGGSFSRWSGNIWAMHLHCEMNPTLEDLCHFAWLLSCWALENALSVRTAFTLVTAN